MNRILLLKTPEEPKKMAFEFLELPYDFAALEPHIDAQTMQIHYGKHHRAYYDKMATALEGSEGWMMGIERLLGSVSSMGAAVRNNAGGYYNHNLYWASMSPDGGGDPQGALAAEINRVFGSADELRTEMTNAGIGRFGNQCFGCFGRWRTHAKYCCFDN